MARDETIPMKTLFPPVVFIAPSRTTLPPAQIYEADEATGQAYRWLLSLGFPADVAAARVMPALFAEPGAAAAATLPSRPSFDRAA